MAIDIISFRARFPEFDETTYPDDMVQLALDDAMLCVVESFWLKFYEVGVMYLAAHELVLGKERSESGGSFTPVLLSSSETTEKISYTDAINSIDVNDGKVVLFSTKYGLKHYEYFMKVRPMGSFIVLS